jgi:nucleotide-binding universal stress UspA family protein
MITDYKSDMTEDRQTEAATMDLLLAYDGSDHAIAAVDFVQDLPLSDESSITLLAVMPTQHIHDHEKLQAKLEKTKNRLAGGDAKVSSILKAGNPAATINEQALEMNTDLIVIGAKGLRATLGILLGGVAQQVVEYSCCPVLVVRAPHHEVKQVLLVTDGSQYSQTALACLAPESREKKPRFPLKPDTIVHVMHVLPPPVTADMISTSWTVGPEALFPLPAQDLDLDALAKREQNVGQELLDGTLETMKEWGFKAVGHLPRGDAATEILDFASHQQIDLIVCGSRGLNPVTSWLLGSVSRKLVHYSDCSVMVVKDKTNRLSA